VAWQTAVPRPADTVIATQPPGDGCQRGAQAQGGDQKTAMRSKQFSQEANGSLRAIKKTATSASQGGFCQKSGL